MSKLRVSVSNFLKCLLKPQMHAEMLEIKDTQRHNKASVCFRRYSESISSGSTRVRDGVGGVASLWTPHPGVEEETGDDLSCYFQRRAY